MLIVKIDKTNVIYIVKSRGKLIRIFLKSKDSLNFSTARDYPSFLFGVIMKDRKAYQKAYYQEHKEQIKEQRKAYIKAYNQAHKEDKKAWREANIEHYRAYQKAYKKDYTKAEVNTLGQTKSSIRLKSRQILKQMNLNIPGYQIHHCFTYNDPSKFIYISKSLHLKIHQYLRDNNIDADTDHWMAIRDLVNSTYEFMYIKD